MTIWRLANRDDSPRAVWRVGPNAFYAGEEVIDYFERTERWDAAELGPVVQDLLSKAAPKVGPFGQTERAPAEAR